MQRETSRKGRKGRKVNGKNSRISARLFASFLWVDIEVESPLFP